MSRDIRRLINFTEQPQTFSNGSPASSLQEGGVSVSLEGGRLAVFRKHKGLVFKSFMTSDGNQYVDRNLQVSGEIRGNELAYTNHNVHNPGTSKIYLGLNNSTKNTSIGHESTWIAPYNGVLKKILIYSDASGGNTTVGLHINANATAQKSITQSLSATTTLEYIFSDLNNFDKSDLLSVSVDCSTDPIHIRAICVWQYNTLNR
jgi:hypothetical protein